MINNKVIFETNTTINNKVYKCFRIPAIIKVSNGVLLAFAEGRRFSFQDHGDIDLVLRRSLDTGHTWEPHQILWNKKGTCGNPCPIYDERTNTVHLIMTWNDLGLTEKDIVNGRGYRFPYICSSKNNGKTWTNPRCIQATTRDPSWRWYATGPGNGIQLHFGNKKGRLICPCNHTNSKKQHKSHIIYSDDHGKIWHKGAAQPINTNESCVAELFDGTLLHNLRKQNKNENNRSIGTSYDGGETWFKTHLSKQLKGAKCQGSMIRFKHDILLFTLPADSSRKKLTLWVSYNGGISWISQYVLFRGSSAYSNLVKIDNNTLGVLFECDKYRKIVFQSYIINSLFAKKGKRWGYSNFVNDDDEGYARSKQHYYFDYMTNAYLTYNQKNKSNKWTIIELPTRPGTSYMACFDNMKLFKINEKGFIEDKIKKISIKDLFSRN